MTSWSDELPITMPTTGCTMLSRVPVPYARALSHAVTCAARRVVAHHGDVAEFSARSPRLAVVVHVRPGDLRPRRSIEPGCVGAHDVHHHRRGARSRSVDPQGRPLTASRWFVNWLVRAPSMVQWPVLWGRSAISLTTRPAVAHEELDREHARPRPSRFAIFRPSRWASCAVPRRRRRGSGPRRTCPWTAPSTPGGSWRTRRGRRAPTTSANSPRRLSRSSTTTLRRRRQSRQSSQASRRGSAGRGRRDRRSRHGRPSGPACPTPSRKPFNIGSLADVTTMNRGTGMPAASKARRW